MKKKKSWKIFLEESQIHTKFLAKTFVVTGQTQSQNQP